MRLVARPAQRSVSGALAAILVTIAALLLSRSDASAQRQLVDPRAVSVQPADLPRGFAVVERETAFEQLRTGQTGTDADVVGVNFKTATERPRTLEHLQSGPVRVGQIIARSDDPTRATFSLNAQREFNVREHAYEVVEAGAECDEILCLVRRDGPFVEYRIAAIKNDDTLVSTTTIGLPSAVHLDGAIALTKLSLARYDEQVSSLLAIQQQPQAADARSLNPEARAVATPTPTPAPAPPPPPAAPATPTARPTAQTAKAKLPSRFDQRFGDAWSELMSNTATTKSGEKIPPFMRRIVEETDLEVGVGNLGRDIGGEHRSVMRTEGERAKIIESEITLNKDVIGESPRVLAAMLAHEITHANQPISRSGKPTDCVEDEVEAYGVQARVWAAFWGLTVPPGTTKWERTMNYVTEIGRDSGDAGLRQLVKEETSTSTHSCIE